VRTELATTERFDSYFAARAWVKEQPEDASLAYIAVPAMTNEPEVEKQKVGRAHVILTGRQKANALAR